MLQAHLNLDPAHALHRRQSQSGLTLVELLVSLVIGLIIVLAATSSYLGASSASKLAEQQSRMNEDAQEALTLLAQQIRMAGANPLQNYKNKSGDFRNPVYCATNTTDCPARNAANTIFNDAIDDDATLGFYVLRGCDGSFSNVKTANNLPTLTCVDAVTTQPDSIAITYEADRYNTPASSGGLPTDCLGNTLTGGTAQVLDAATGAAKTSDTYYVADNRYFIGTSSAITAPSLYCKGSGNVNAQPLVENVEDLQLTYGVADPSNTGNFAIAGYLDAYGLRHDNTKLASLSETDRWKQVLAVRICVVIRSADPVLPDSGSARYVQCDGTVNTNPPDLRLRKAYSTTVLLRNRGG